MSAIQQLIDNANAQTLKDHPDTAPSQLLALNPNLLPAIGYGVLDARAPAFVAVCRIAANDIDWRKQA